MALYHSSADEELCKSFGVTVWDVQPGPVHLFLYVNQAVSVMHSTMYQYKHSFFLSFFLSFCLSVCLSLSLCCLKFLCLRYPPMPPSGLLVWTA